MKCKNCRFVAEGGLACSFGLGFFKLHEDVTCQYHSEVIGEVKQHNSTFCDGCKKKIWSQVRMEYVCNAGHIHFDKPKASQCEEQDMWSDNADGRPRTTALTVVDGGKKEEKKSDTRHYLPPPKPKVRFYADDDIYIQLYSA